MSRILYLFYYLKQLDWEKLRGFQRHVKVKHGRPVFLQWVDMIGCSIRYNCSLLEYYQFGFYELPAEERQKYAGTGCMYEYQKRMNPPASREVLSDKIQFLRVYGEFVHHSYATVDQLEEAVSATSAFGVVSKAGHLSQPSPQEPDDLLHQLFVNASGKVVLKSSDGQCGRGIEVVETAELRVRGEVEKVEGQHVQWNEVVSETIRRLKSGGNDFVEEYVTQHSDLMRLSPSGLNTVRVITQLDQQDQVHLLGARLRITVNSSVDNMAAGNMAASIDPDTGRVNGPGVYSDITKREEQVHPVTGVPIEGFQVPYWEEILAMCKKAALIDTSNRSVGWDVAVTERGPELIEGNHDWCKLLWQLPVKQGLKHVLLNYE